MRAKEMVLGALHRLPEDIDFKDITEEIAFLAAIREGEDDIKLGRVISNEEMKQRLYSWLTA
jgi:predicted transcriptional regulator